MAMIKNMDGVSDLGQWKDRNDNRKRDVISDHLNNIEEQRTKWLKYMLAFLAMYLVSTCSSTSKYVFVARSCIIN